MERETDTDKILRAIADIHDKMATKEELAEVKLAVNTLQTTVGTLQSTVGTLQTTVGTLQASVNSMETDIKSIKIDVRELADGAFTKMEKEDLLARVSFLETEAGVVV